jgi:hypothetical protein
MRCFGVKFPSQTLPFLCKNCCFNLDNTHAKFDFWFNFAHGLYKTIYVIVLDLNKKIMSTLIVSL